MSILDDVVLLHTLAELWWPLECPWSFNMSCFFFAVSSVVFLYHGATLAIIYFYICFMVICMYVYHGQLLLYLYVYMCVCVSVSTLKYYILVCLFDCFSPWFFFYISWKYVHVYIYVKCIICLCDCCTG